MKNFKIDNFDIKTRQRNNQTNYGLSIQVFEGKKLIAGTILKNGSNELHILKNAIRFIDDYKNPKNQTIEDYFN